MKNLLALSFVLFVFANQLQAQCNPYFQLKQGASWEMTSYNAKDKQEGRTKHEVIAFNETSDGFESTLKMTAYDKKDKESFVSEFAFSCANQVIEFDMRQFMASESMESFKSMNMEITGDNLEYPASLTVGDELKPGKMTLEMAGSSAMPMAMNFTVEIANRKVEAREEITTPAGTFDCYKISSLVKTKTVMKMEMKSVEWVAEGRGVVKTMSYNKNGKMIGYSLLTKLN
jgi:hypothetical protein